MKKLLAIIMAAAGLLFVAAGFASAEPGPNGNNDHGLCTAYFNGQKVGHGPGEDTDDPPPFQGLQETGENYTDNDGRDNDGDGRIDEPDETDPNDTEAPEHTDLTDAENIWNYCENSGDESLIGGNPDHGRFECMNQADNSDPSTWTTLPNNGPDDASDPECSRNEKPGNGDDQEASSTRGKKR